MNVNRNNVSRRGFLSFAAAAAAIPALAACGGGGGGASGSDIIKFWDMPWGAASYNDAGKKIIDGYAPASGNLKANYQVIQWNNFYQTYSSAIASKTGPAASSGGGFQAFQFEQQGQIAYADNVIEALKQNGMFDDFLPGVLDPFKSDKGYIAVPWQLDIRVFWYRKSLLEQADVDVPTDWASLLEAGKALKKIGVYGFATGAGAGNNMGIQSTIMMLLNNGGGFFSPDGQLDVVNDRNVEATEFLLELASNSIIDPGSVSYTADNLITQWKDKKAAIGIHSYNLPTRIGDTSGDMLVPGPIAGPHGDKACLSFTNNLMMYKNNPSQASTEAFLVHYLGQIKQYWEQNLINALPAFKSIAALPAFAGDPNNAKIIKEWQPIAKSYAARSTKLTAGIAPLESSQALLQFTQTVFTGKGDAKSALTTLQSGLQSVLKS